MAAPQSPSAKKFFHSGHETVRSCFFTWRNHIVHNSAINSAKFLDGYSLQCSRNKKEAAIRVKNGYTPNRIVVHSGKPIRFEFTREEKAACSEMVVFPDFQKSALLPVGKKVTIELPPMNEGNYEFTCQMGMYKGTVVVKK
ncbi:MAG: cupredoxin domain-containing protein [Ectobacillus sp.]